MPGNLTVTLPLLVTAWINGTGTVHLDANTTWRAGGASIISLTGGVEVMAGRTLTLNGEQCCDFPNRYLIDSSLRNHGTVVWTFGAITLRNTSTITNEIDGTWEVQGNQTVTFDGSGTPAFVNNGVLLRSGAPNRLTVTPPFTNTGTLHVRIGGAGSGEFDEFGGGTIALGGTLSAQLINGFSPLSSDQFKVMDYTSISGAFATLTGDGFFFSACYTPTALFVCNVITEKLTPTITWANPADIVLRHGPRHHAAERHGLGTRDVRVLAGRRDDSGRRERSDPPGCLHPDGHRSLQQCKCERSDQRRSSDAHYHVGEPGRYRLRNGVDGDAAQRQRRSARWDVRLHSGCRGRTPRRQQSAAVGHLYAGRQRQLRTSDGGGGD